MNKLSPEVLCDVFTKIEVQGARVFAIIGHPASTQVLYDVLKAHYPARVTEANVVWGALLVNFDDLPQGVLHLRVTRNPSPTCRPTLKDLCATVFPESPDYVAPTDVTTWTVSLDLR